VGSGKTGILDFLPPNSFSDGLFRYNTAFSSSSDCSHAIFPFTPNPDYRRQRPSRLLPESATSRLCRIFRARFRRA